MLIVCSGPDTWRARRRAKELLEAFKTKHDSSGFSTETIGSGDFQATLSQIGTPSIFSRKRMIRCDGLLSSLKIADVRRLAARLKEDGGNTVVLSVEDEPPSQKILVEFKDSDCHVYDYPQLFGVEFEKVCLNRSKELGVDEDKVKEIVARCEGDVWMAENELMKLSANAKAPLSELEMDLGSSFNAVDKYLMRAPCWRSLIHSLDDDQMPSLIFTQTKSALRVQDGESVKIPPFAIKKYQSLSNRNIKLSFYNALKACLSLRNGLGSTKEVDTLF